MESGDVDVDLVGTASLKMRDPGGGDVRLLFGRLAVVSRFLALTLAAGACAGNGTVTENSAPAITTVAAAPTTTVAAPTTVHVIGGWVDDEQAAFRRVLDAFSAQTGQAVEFFGIERDLPGLLWSQIEAGDAPDVVLLPHPGLLRELVEAGVLVPIEDHVGAAVDRHFAPVWRELGSANGTLYGLFFKVANKSTVWYDVAAFAELQLDPPADWDGWLAVAAALHEAGRVPLAVAGGDGWVLSDWFENVYLRTAGPERYDQLARHEIPWTDASVKEALSVLGELLGVSDYLARGRDGAIEVQFAESVRMVFSEAPEAAIVYEGDFVAGFAESETGALPVTDFDFFEWPSIDGSPPAVVGGGDVAVLLSDHPGAARLMQYLATPAAAEVWAALGGFSSPNRDVDPAVYPNDVVRASAAALADAEVFRFDLSDLVPAQLGSTRDAGIWGRLQDWMLSPEDLDTILEQLESEAAAAYGDG